MALIDDFKARFPDIATATVDTWLPILEPVYPAYYAIEYTSSAVAKEATLNLLAHLIVLESNGTVSGVKGIQSKSVGSISVSHEAISHAGGEMFDFYNTTKYGQRFWQLTARRYGGIAV